MNGKLYFEEKDRLTADLHTGELVTDGCFWLATLAKPGGEVRGDIRLRNQSGGIISNFRAPGSARWEDDRMATEEDSNWVTFPQHPISQSTNPR